MPGGKSHTVKVANLPKSKPMCFVSNKPILLIVGVCSAPIIVYFTFGNKIMVLPFLVYTMIFCLKKEKVIFTGHNSFFVIYDLEDEKNCDIYYLSEVKKWCYVNTLFSPHVLFLLNDGESVTLKSSGSEVVRYLRKVMRKKEVEKKSK